VYSPAPNSSSTKPNAHNGRVASVNAIRTGRRMSNGGSRSSARFSTTSPALLEIAAPSTAVTPRITARAAASLAR